MKFTKEELIEKSKVYFEKNPRLHKMLATPDGNFFYPEGEHYAYSHARTNGFQVEEIRKEDTYPKEEVEEVESVVNMDMTKKELIDYAEENGIEINPADIKRDIVETINND